jgi:outer membrane protein TolC
MIATAESGSEKSVPITLREAVEQALANNLNLKLQQEETNVATGAIDIARSRFDKSLSAEIGASGEESTPLYTGAAEHEDSGNLSASLNKRFTTGTEMELGWSNTHYDSDADGLDLNPSYGSSISLGLTQPLLRGWGKDIQTSFITAAEKDLTAATFQVDSLAADLAAQVKSGYWNLVFAWQDIEVKRLSLTLARKLLEETVAKIEAGKLAEVELYQPQSEVARREEELIAAERAIGIADDELKLLLNSDSWFTPFSPVDLPRTEPVQLSPQSILDNALTNRPDLKAAQMGIDAASIRKKLAEDELRPSLNLVGTLGYGGTDDGYGNALDAALDEPDTNWALGLNFTLPLDNSAAKGSLQQARAAQSKAKTTVQLLKLQVTKGVRTTVRDVELAIKAMEATRKTSYATGKRLEAEQAKFDAGRSTTLDVLIAQDAYSKALSQEKLTNITYVQALAELDRIQGLITLPPLN